MTLYGYFRSSSAYRVRIALNLKGLAVTHRPRHLRKGEQRSAEYLALNPQGLVPALVDENGHVLIQSLAIIEWLDESWPDPPLLPAKALARARVRAFAQIIACDTSPLQNLKVLTALRRMDIGEEEVIAWAAAANRDGLAACEALLRDEQGPFCFGAAPSLADICLVPQLASARRFGVDVSRFPRLLACETAARALPAFAAAEPERQIDAE
jgi:maleylpyruvate isomerase